MIYIYDLCFLLCTYHVNSVFQITASPSCPKQATLEEDRELFLKFSSILCLWFEIQGRRTDNFFDWVLNTGKFVFRWVPLNDDKLGR